MNYMHSHGDWIHSNLMWSIAYCSRMSTFMSDRQLYELVARAESRNHQMSVSGVLLVRGNCFLQILEGHAGFVHELYQSIAADSRHTSVTKLLDAPIAGPAFSGWPMRLITIDDISREERDIVERALDAVERHPAEAPLETDLACLSACSGALARGVYRKPDAAVAGSPRIRDHLS